MTFSKVIKISFTVAILLIVSTVFYTVDETRVAVLTRFGKPFIDIKGPGLHFKLPWPIDKAIKVDKRILVLESMPQELLTEDQKNVVVESFMTWRITDPLLFVKTVQTRQKAEDRLIDLYESRMGATIGGHPLHNFISIDSNEVEYHDISNHVVRTINRIVGESIGVELIDLRLTSFTLPAQNRGAVIARMNAERATIAAKYRSSGEEQALKIEGEAEAEHKKILGHAHAEAEAIRGEGEAKALTAFAKAYEQDEEFYRFMRSLESYETIINDETTLFIESDSKLLRALNGK